MFDETIQSEESCLWSDDIEDDDETCDDEDGYDDDQEDEDEEEYDPVPRFIEYRFSPACRLSSTVRMLAERYSEQINELLNIFGGALSESVRVHASYPPFHFTSRRDRIFYGRLLTSPGELEAVEEEVRAERPRLWEELGDLTGDSPRADFQRAEHHLRDYRILVALVGCHASYVFHWWDTALIFFQRSEILRQFYRARDAMRSRDPKERNAARARDAKRRKTRNRREYLAKFEARPDVRAKRAERKRAARAAARERKLAQAQSAEGVASVHLDAVDCPESTPAIRREGPDARTAEARAA